MRTLGGKWVWVWNARRCDGGDAGRMAARLSGAGCEGALVKAFDGPRWFDQGRAWREIAAALRAHGVGVGGWGYLYGDDPAGEAQRAIETAQYGEADLLVLDVETEFKGQAAAAEEVCRRIREAVGPHYPLYFSSFAIARYHRTFPFGVFNRYCTGAAPQVYWNAFRWPVEQALSMTYEDHAALGIAPERVYPVGGLYQEGLIRYPPPDEVREFGRTAARRGSPGVSFWSYEHMDEEMWQAVGSFGRQEEENDMSSEEFDQVNRSLDELLTRVLKLEADVRSLRASTATVSGTYVVRPGDTLSGIAQKLGIADWRRLYEANRALIGPDPNRIFPGQTLIVP
jgi:nucleoid-associated protein YgaU